tara:strand:+ start:32321 stop:32842 length:522 start_codon:yes stop_codon:yes gene_type:complete
MINDKILSKFKNISEWTLFLNERINDGHEISKGKLSGETSKYQKEKDLEKKRIDLKRRGYSEAKDDKAHDRNTKTKEVHVKKSANGSETHKTIEKEPMPDQDQEQDQEQQMPPQPPPVQPQPGSQVKIGRKDGNVKIDPAAVALKPGKNLSQQKIDMKPKIAIKADTDYGVKK